ncbi:hypothetical protein [Enterococcus gallinarum]|uniref:hypothetical protein n=1 Tax=Enterococcus gallinarum TaxID=1353 RepID=UPI0018AB9123|nr:hypothetical protein [Enterococcus gallinarum]MDT2679845.1 hypothetical protein [Enterococcus gallinarum]
MIANTVMYGLFGGILMVVGLLMVKEAKSKVILAIGIILFVAGLAIGIWSQVNLYVNGTPEELAKYLFWFGRR